MTAPDERLTAEQLEKLRVFAQTGDLFVSSRVLVLRLLDEHEHLAADLARADKDLAQLKVALVMEQRLREQDSISKRELTDANTVLRGELSHLRVEMEAMRAELDAALQSVQDATQAVLEAGAEMSIERARAALGEGEAS